MEIGPVLEFHFVSVSLSQVSVKIGLVLEFRFDLVDKTCMCLKSVSKSFVT